MTKKITICLAMLLIAGMAYGQSLQGYKSQIAQPAASGARVLVEEVGDAAAVIRSVPAGNTGRKVNGYRIEIFFDTSANARRLAVETHAKFTEMFPDIPTDVTRDIKYESPKYTVRVGYFLRHEEAIIMCGRIKSVFEKAYPRSEKLSLSDFVITRTTPESN